MKDVHMQHTITDNNWIWFTGLENTFACFTNVWDINTSVTNLRHLVHRSKSYGLYGLCLRRRFFSYFKGSAHLATFLSRQALLLASRTGILSPLYTTSAVNVCYLSLHSQQNPSLYFCPCSQRKYRIGG